MKWIYNITMPDFSGLLEISILAVIIYFVLDFFRGTRSTQVLTGFVLFLFVMLAVTKVFHLDTLNWILQRVSVYLAIAMVVIFQPEIRRALAEIGKQHVFLSNALERNMLDHIVAAVSMLSERKIGALIAIEKEIGTRAIQETGIKIDSTVTPELLASIFFPHTPLHDGGVIIRENRIVAAGCVFPLSQRQELNKTLGTRHRAAVGMTEETDAVIIVISEETGTISLAYKGRLTRGLDEDRVKRMLSRILLKGKKKAEGVEREMVVTMDPDNPTKTSPS